MKTLMVNGVNIHPAKFPDDQRGIHGSGAPGNELYNGGNIR
ncbi:hypothetical protein [Listeria monocytogenes]|nr:hypothetical protein [Listeria monocytogenes]AFH78670.1 hypothetical protein MUO_00475 [Listeria monocytogenes 07PF0776]